jgi:phosphocarrier protein
MKQFDYTIKDPLGIHARPAGLFAKLAKGFGDTVVTISKDGNTVKASQLMKVMSMGIKSGHTITVAAEGPAEDEAIEAVKKFLEENL